MTGQLKQWSGVAFRALNFNPPPNATLKDLVDYEAGVLGNSDIKRKAMASAKELGISLAAIRAKDALWVTRTRDQARQYGNEEDIQAKDVDGWSVIVDLGEEGMLVADISEAQRVLVPLTESKFYSKYAVHVDIQARGGLNNVLAIFKDGFRRSQNVNTLPPYRGGKPTNVVEARYAPRKGDVVYLVPLKDTRETGNGPAVATGWKPQPHEVVIASEDYPTMYLEYLKAFKQPGPVSNGAAFGQLHHGTARAFTKFNPPVGRRRGGGYDHQGPGFYLTSDPGFGKFFARTAASLTDDDEFGDGEVMDVKLKPEAKILDLRSPNADTLALLLLKNSTDSKEQGLALRARVLALGYDGVAFTEPNFPEGWKVDPQATTVVMYEPSLVAIPGAEPTDTHHVAGGKGRMPVFVEMIGRQSVRAFAGKRVVGGASAWEDSRGEFVILKAEVKEPYRRRGIATAMYKAIEEATGKQLVPAVALSDDAFEFWKSFRPDAVAKDLRHRKQELLGVKALKYGRLGTIIEASGGIATMRFDDAVEGSANSQTCVHRDDLDDAIAAARNLSQQDTDCSIPDEEFSQDEAPAP